MDFEMMNFVGSSGAENGEGTSLGLSEPETGDPNNNHGSGYLKQDRSGCCEENERASKVARTDDCVAPKRMLMYQQNTTPLLRSHSVMSGDDAHNMLSFSSTKAEIPFLRTVGGEGRTNQTQSSIFPPFQQASASSRTAGYDYGGLSSDIYGLYAGFRGPFTQSQWMELEHQSLIYKHIVSKVPVPSNLLIPLKKSLNPYAFSGWSSLSYNPNTLGWGSFHLGFPGNTDPEPGRCRRTDGKKWRCSRYAVLDQKYCERHINRGRHRSRKPVEGQTGRAVSGSITPKVATIASSTSETVMSSSGSSCAIIQNHFKIVQPGAANFPTDALISRKEDTQGLLPPAINFKSISQKQHDPFQESSWSGFGLVSSDSLLNPSQGNSYLDSKNCSSFIDSNDHKMHDQHPLRHFIDDWPKDQSDRVTLSWPEDLKSDWTQLSMAIPMASSAFSSTSNLPRQDKLTLSSLRLSHEFDPIQMGLGMSSDPSEPIQKQANWLPIAWGNSVGGPLGEVLSSTSSTVGASKNPYAVSISTEAWDGSPQFGSSPTGVLHGSTFVSLSNSSTGSSPRTDKRAREGANIDDLFGSTLVSSSSMPSF